MEREKLFEVKGLKKYFKGKDRQIVRAVDDISFDIYRGEILSLVGESGCGKTTCGRTCVGLYLKTEGQVLYCGRDVSELRRRERMWFARRVQTIFQDPYSSLDPTKRAGDIIAEGIDIHHLAENRKKRQKMVEDLLEQVGLTPDCAHRMVGEFSGGQRQRIGIARALALRPEFILCDEPVSALDVSIQAQIINLLKELQKKNGLTYLFIAHDLALVKHISDRVIVMYLGQIAEIASARDLFANPQHPYTQTLLAAVPVANPQVRLQTEDAAVNEPAEGACSTGCLFADRCRYVSDRCRKERPGLYTLGDGHQVACHRFAQ